LENQANEDPYGQHHAEAGHEAGDHFPHLFSWTPKTFVQVIREKQKRTGFVEA
jgi:hypothetical protein